MEKKRIGTEYQFLIKLLETIQKNHLSINLEKNPYGILVRNIQTVRAKNPQNEWEGDLVPTILIELETKQNDFFEILKNELENLRTKKDEPVDNRKKINKKSELANFLKLDINGIITNRIGVKINGQQIYYFPPQDPQEYRLDGSERTKILEEEYKPRYLQQKVLIEELTGPDEKSILETAKKDYMVDWLLHFVANHFKIEEHRMLSKTKTQDLVVARGIYSYFLHRKLKYSLPQIGRRLGGRDHTTILGVVRKIETIMRNDKNKFKENEELWKKANTEFEIYVKNTNKQLNLQNQEI